jgi:hypothetical protein
MCYVADIFMIPGLVHIVEMSHEVVISVFSLPHTFRLLKRVWEFFKKIFKSLAWVFLIPQISQVLVASLVERGNHR